VNQVAGITYERPLVVGTEVMTKNSHEAFEKLFLLLTVYANREFGVAVGHSKEQTEE